MNSDPTPCSTCVHARSHVWNTHISCAKPDDRLIPGPAHAMRQGWYVYPFLFDPVWKPRACGNHQPEEAPHA